MKHITQHIIYNSHKPRTNTSNICATACTPAPQPACLTPNTTYSSTPQPACPHQAPDRRPQSHSKPAYHRQLILRRATHRTGCKKRAGREGLVAATASPTNLLAANYNYFSNYKLAADLRRCEPASRKEPPTASNVSATAGSPAPQPATASTGTP